jgi:hypothetical protein
MQQWRTNPRDCGPAFAIKFTIYRARPSGSPGDPDIFGAQQYAPLMDVEIPLPGKAA